MENFKRYCVSLGRIICDKILLTNQINAVDTQVGRNHNRQIIAFIALIVFAVGIPQLITVFQGRKLREQAEKYEELKQDIEMLKQQIIRVSEQTQ